MPLTGIGLAAREDVLSRAPPISVKGVRVTSPDKLLWPDEPRGGIRKLDLVRYYEAIAPVVLRYVRHRPLTLRPFMQGIGGRSI